ncbi:flagella cluster protein [Salinadaptatus halalkaliphilus]|uniref:Flagella cluster protein n=1 Tax=Salinadaptatus halalkaliphilus TaxID=2419781 RepID=A0A4S3TK34_9EURY|nr:flagella cluster protein [Salinadaptatus halalkaliphilus]THE62938.1 flagella cluster protein [Salinadaptatus halalkaliphilus]
MTDSNEGGDPKEKADVPPVLPNEQPTASEAGGVLSPDELDFTDSPHVAEVADDRYVVSADKRPPTPSNRETNQPDRSSDPSSAHSTPTPSEPSAESATNRQPAATQQPVQSPETARSVLATELERANARYAMDIVSQFNGTTIRHRTTSDDVVGTFDNLVLWYAQHVASDTSTQRTASLLFEKSEFSSPLSPDEVRREAKQRGLSRSSSIGELLDALE